MISEISDGRVVCVQHHSLVKQQVSYKRQGMLTLDVAPDSIHTCCESVSSFLSLICHSNGTDVNKSLFCLFPYSLCIVVVVVVVVVGGGKFFFKRGLGFIYLFVLLYFVIFAILSSLRNRGLFQTNH